MNVTRVLQPYVCCIGNPVAGNPTQFVMYRAARACGVDWRFFTSQVDLDQFETAFRGVQALGLSGVALFDPFQSAALPLLDSVTESALCLGRVNVARQDGNSWLGDNTLGAGIINCIKSAKASRFADDSDLEKPDGAVILVVGNPNIAKAMRLAYPELSTRIAVVSNLTEANEKESDSEMSTQPSEKDPLKFTSLDDFAQSELRVGSLVIEDVPNTQLTRQLTTLPWLDAASCLILTNSSDKPLRQWREAMKAQNVVHLEPADLMACQSAADFFFWTGVLPTLELIRDSLDEYMQW